MNKENILYSFGGLLLGFVIAFATFSSFAEKNLAKEDTNQNKTANSMAQTMDGMMHGISQKTGDEFDKAFLNEMIVHHEGAVEMAKDALKNAKHQEIKDMAKNIIDAQEKEIGQMKSWLGAWYSVK